MNHEKIFGESTIDIGFTIDSLVWIAASCDSSQVQEFLQDINSDFFFNEFFPNMSEEDVEYLQSGPDPDQIKEILFDNKRLGFLARVLLPESNRFRFEKGRPVSWSVSSNIFNIEYVYAETLPELIKAIKKKAKANFNYCVKQEKV